MSSRTDDRGDGGGPEGFARDDRARVEFRSRVAAPRASPRETRTSKQTRSAGVTGDRWGEVERLLHEAMQLPTGERVAFVANIGDANVWAEVSSLLAAERERDGAPGDAVIGEAARAVSDEPMTGRMLGHFRVVKSIGHGAMGEVY